MLRLTRDLDRVLRGEFTKREDLQQGRLGISATRLLSGSLLLGAVYGVFMGMFGLLRAEAPSWEQMVATIVKVPILFLLTLLVTFPSLYVFSALAGSRLRFLETLRLLLAAITVNLIVLASFGPVTGFFTLSTTSYPFMVLLNVLVFAIAGFVGVAFLRRALGPVFETPANATETPQHPAENEASAETPEARRPSRAHRVRDPARPIFRVWIVIFGIVGAQMGWILRPFIGDPNLPFQILRDRESNFFEAVVQTFIDLFS